MCTGLLFPLTHIALFLFFLPAPRIGRTGRVGNPGLATAFVNDDSSSVCRNLVELLEENKQEVPPWLMDMSMKTRGSPRGKYEFRQQKQSQRWKQRYYMYKLELP